MGLKFKKFNAVNDSLPQDLDNNLQAFAQETGQISYTDIMNFKGDAEKYRKLRYHLNKWNEYIESGQDDKALKKSDDIRAMIKGQKDFGFGKKTWHIFALDIEGGAEEEVGTGDYTSRDEAEAAWNEIANENDQKYSNPKFKCYSKKHTIDLKKFSSEIAAVVLKNADGTHEVISIQDESDEERVQSYVKDEGAKVIKRCRNTKEADEYIESKKLTRAYSDSYTTIYQVLEDKTDRLFFHVAYTSKAKAEEDAKDYDDVHVVETKLYGSKDDLRNFSYGDGDDPYIADLEEYIFGAQGKIRLKELFEEYSKGYLKKKYPDLTFDKMIKDAIKLVKDRKKSDDWGNWDGPEDRDAIIKQLEELKK